MSDIPAGWQTDPTGKHDHRYWDGTQWTDNVADAGVASKDAYEPVADAAPEPEATAPDPPPEVVSPDTPTVVTPVSSDDTTAYPAAAAPPPYVPPTPVATGGDSSSGGSKRGLIIGGAILAAVVLAVIAFVALGGDDDDPTGPLADETTPTAEDEDEGDGRETLEDLRDACADGDFGACDELWISADGGSELEEFGSTCGGITEPQAGSCEATNGGENPFGGFSDGDMEDILEETYQQMGLSEEEAECLSDRILEAIEDGELDEDAALTQLFTYLSDCDISMEDLGGTYPRPS
jgi:Protein of unknown function (DUF2510)